MGKRRIVPFILLLFTLYLGVGLAFHLKWKRDLEACRKVREAHGEFVEPEVLGGVVGFIFDITNWPTYAWANLYHYGTVFATPCTRRNR